MLAGMVGWTKVRKTAEDVSQRLADTAADTRASIIGVAVLALAALGVALVALVMARKARLA